jgi:hypothetical protein
VKRRRRKTEAISHATFLSIYGKRGFAKKIAEVIACGPYEYRGLMKGTLLHLALNNPKVLREVAYELCRFQKDLKRPFKCPRGADLIAAYETCASFPPTFSEVKHAFIAWFGKKKWNGGHDDDQSHGDSSARKTLKILGLPLKEMKKGRPVGSKSFSLGPQGLREGISKK